MSKWFYYNPTVEKAVSESLLHLLFKSNLGSSDSLATGQIFVKLDIWYAIWARSLSFVDLNQIGQLPRGDYWQHRRVHLAIIRLNLMHLGRLSIHITWTPELSFLGHRVQWTFNVKATAACCQGLFKQRRLEGGFSCATTNLAQKLKTHYLSQKILKWPLGLIHPLIRVSEAIFYYQYSWKNTNNQWRISWRVWGQLSLIRNEVTPIGCKIQKNAKILIKFTNWA